MYNQCRSRKEGDFSAKDDVLAARGKDISANSVHSAPRREAAQRDTPKNEVKIGRQGMVTRTTEAEGVEGGVDRIVVTIKGKTEDAREALLDKLVTGFLENLNMTTWVPVLRPRRLDWH
jgi:hypothetical protein